MSIIRAWPVLALALCGTSAIAQGAAPPAPAADAEDVKSPWKVSGSIRARYETIDGQARAGFNDTDNLVSLRTRIAAEYDAGVLRFGGELYDSRAFEADAGTPLTTGEVNTLELVQLYAGAAFENPLGAGSKAALDVGRFMLNLGSRRLVAADDYRNTTNGYTGVRLDASFAGGSTANLIYVLPQLRRPDDFASLENNETELDRETTDLQLFGGLYTLPVAPAKAALQLSYIGLDEADQSDLATRDRKLDTFGLRYWREPAADTFDFDVEAFAQTGEISASTAPAAATLDVSAHFIHAEAGYRWSGPGKPRLSAEFDYASGDEPGGDYNRIDTLFGMRRAEIGPSGIYNAVGRANLSSPGIRLEVEPDPSWDAFLALRGLWLASDTDAFSTTGVRDATGASGDYAGTQFDARVRYWLVPQKLRLETNIIYLAKGDFLKNAPNAPNTDDTLYANFDVTVSF